MYRSIHSGTCPPTGSTFCTTNNAYSCGIYNLGGSTDGAPPLPSTRWLATGALSRSGWGAAAPSQRAPYQSHKLKRNNATMGAARVTRSAPGEYLRKGASKTVLPAPGNFSYGDSAKKPGVPRRSEQPVHGLTTSKNFITSNAIENILSGALFSSSPRSFQRSENLPRCSASNVEDRFGCAQSRRS